MAIAAYATLNARIQPMDRGDRYEAPLLDALESGVIANVVGGGSQLLPGGNEIEYCCIDLEIFDLKRGLPLVTSILETAGAPKGSYLSYVEDDESHRIPFGRTHGIAIYLNGTELPSEVYSDCDVNFIIAEIDRLLDGVGSYQSYWEGPTETALYVYGNSRDKMRGLLESFLETYPLCQRARVVDLPDSIQNDG